jgi:hypothetical protein
MLQAGHGFQLRHAYLRLDRSPHTVVTHTLPHPPVRLFDAPLTNPMLMPGAVTGDPCEFGD